MDKKKLISLIERKEGRKLDFKLKLDFTTESAKREFVKDVCAIANSRGGRGYLIIGVEDKTKRIVGIDENDFTEEQIQQIVSTRCDPPIPISLEYIKIKNKIIGVINIYDGRQKPYQIRENGVFYIRRGSTTDVMRKQEIVSVLQENLNLNVEMCPIIRSNIEHLDKELVDFYFNKKGIYVDDDNRMDLMENAGIIIKGSESNNYVATMGGLLVFSKINSLYVPHNMIKIINNINDKFDDVIVVQGDLLKMIDTTKELLYKILPEKYPISPIYEAVKNAVLYRDYTIYNKEIEIMLNYNNISVVSPGILENGGKKISIITLEEICGFMKR
ncbi:divergent AAA domain protein [Clostridium tepidiprofundi DSM 19306]|uniref:Divergent AAA domain protein n=1 Tax=Clostridium tepidiprofundi DSM 19306 TaxID=1121338 RepID=A0A151B2E1_9CLOT|nr:divergent AAA domain protein [Clostridium tepidiprofundi DSM 19306]